MTALTRNEVMDARRRRPGPLGPGYIPEQRGHVGRLVRWGQGERKPAALFPPRKEQAPCCMALVDELGRPPLGFCSPECERRPGNWALVVAGKPIPKGGIPPRPSQGGTT